MKEIQLKDVKVGQGFYVKETGFYYNRITLAKQITATLRKGSDWDHPIPMVPIIDGKYHVAFMVETIPVIIDDF